MKKKTIFPNPLVLSIADMAMILHVSKSQFAMYASGKRGLSVPARVQLESMLTLVHEINFFKKERLVEEIQQEEELLKLYDAQLVTNKWKQLQAAKKLEKMEQKYQAAVQTLQFITHEKAKKAILNADLLQTITHKANTKMQSSSLKQQEVLKIKLEVLELEESVLKRKMQIQLER